jgi:hypothetical protein
MTPDSGDAEVVAHDRDTGLAEPPDNSLDVLNLLVLPRTIEEDVVPVGRVEVLNRGES